MLSLSLLLALLFALASLPPRDGGIGRDAARSRERRPAPLSPGSPLQEV